MINSSFAKLGTPIVAMGLMFGATASAETVLRVRPYGDLRMIDPVLSADYMVRNHGYMIYDTLFALDSQGKIKPQMLDRYSSSEDGLIWTFVLRDGLKFHDNQPVTAEDVVASLKRWGGKDSIGQLLFAKTASLSAEDPKTVKLVLKEKWGWVLEALGKPSSLVPFIMPARIAGASATEAITDPTGSGPFMMVKDQWQPSSRVVYVKAPVYVPRNEPADGLAGGKRANVDRVEWKIISDHQTAYNALAAGEIDLYEELPADLVPLFKGNKKIKVEKLSSAKVFLRMNHTQPPFNNPKVRQALQLGLDQAATMRAYTDDPAFFSTCASFYMCASPYATDGTVKQGDVEGARKLLKESGYRGERTVLMYGSDTPVVSLSLVAAQAVKDIGFNLDLQAMDWGSVAQRRASKNPVEQGGWSAWVSSPAAPDLWDPSAHLALNSSCDKAWYGWSCDEEIEKLRAAFTSEPDLEARKAIAKKIDIRATETVPVALLGEYWLMRGVNSSLKGLIVNDITVYWNISK